MPNSLPSSCESAPSRPAADAPSRIEWRPSRLLAWSLASLGVLGALSVIASEMPPAGAIPLALASTGYGLALARRESRRPAHLLVVVRGQATLDGQRIDEPVLSWRGPLAFLCFRDARGYRRRLAWWPDTLDVTARRELRLAFPVQAAAQPPRSMAS